MRRFVVAALALAASATLSATVLIPTEFREVVADAELIIRGHITDVRALQTPEGRVETAATVGVDNVLKGQADTFISVRVPGGRIGDSRMVMVDAPEFRVGERALFFLKRGIDNAWRPVGLSMGVYPIRVEPLSGQPVIDPPLVAGRTATAGQVIVRGDARRKAMSVGDFESLVQLLVATRTVTATAGNRR